MSMLMVKGNAAVPRFSHFSSLEKKETINSKVEIICSLFNTELLPALHARWRTAQSLIFSQMRMGPVDFPWEQSQFSPQLMDLWKYTGAMNCQKRLPLMSL